MTRLEQLQQFILENPSDPFLHYALTMEYVKLDEETNALGHFEKMISEYPDYVGTYYHFGKFLERLNQKNRAEEIYNKGMEVARSNRNMHAYGELQGALNLLVGFEDDDDEF